jgi:hypothetical protein
MKDLRKILKNCPSGMELDCTLCENVFFDKVIEDAIYPIILYHENNGCRNTLCLTEDGKFNFRPGYKCVIFPKGKTSWEGFAPPCQFKNGDVLESGIGNLVLFSHTKNSFGKDIVYFHCILTPLGKLEIGENCGVGGTEDCTLASDKQKERLFKALNEAGYNWDVETKTLIHNEDNFKITLKLFEQLHSQQIEGVKTEDISNKIAEILSKALKKKIEVKGDGIKADINIKIENL